MMLSTLGGQNSATLLKVFLISLLPKTVSSKILRPSHTYSSRKARKQDSTLQKLVDLNAPLHCQLTSTLLRGALLTAEGLCSVPRSVQLLDLPKMLRVLLMNQEAGLPGRCAGSSPGGLPCRAGAWSPAPSLLPRRSSQPQEPRCACPQILSYIRCCLQA